MITSLNYGRVYFIKRLLIVSAVVHLIYFFITPKDHYFGFLKIFVMSLDICVRVLMSVGNTFLAIYSLELFPTSIRHFTLGILGFITKLMYMLSFIFDAFWKSRQINPNFIIGLLFVGSYFLTVKLR
jgi:OCT family organic cation transporter-like MFS transporter 4/5